MESNDENISKIFIFFDSYKFILNFLCNFNLDVLCLVRSGAGGGSGAGSGDGSATDSGAGSRSGVGFLSFISNIPLLKLLRTFGIALKNNPMWFRKDLLNWFYTFLYTL